MTNVQDPLTRVSQRRPHAVVGESDRGLHRRRLLVVSTVVVVIFA
jgi:hypothetical protein